MYNSNTTNTTKTSSSSANSNLMLPYNNQAPPIVYYDNATTRYASSTTASSANIQMEPILHQTTNGQQGTMPSSSCSASSNTQAPLNDDLLLVDLDFSLLINNNNSNTTQLTRLTNRSTNSTKTNNNAATNYYHNLQRPPPLSTPAVISSFDQQHHHHNQHDDDNHHHHLFPSFNSHNTPAQHSTSNYIPPPPPPPPPVPVQVPATSTTSTNHNSVQQKSTISNTNLNNEFNSANVDLTSTDLDSILLDDYLDPNTTTTQTTTATTTTGTTSSTSNSSNSNSNNSNGTMYCQTNDQKLQLAAQQQQQQQSQTNYILPQQHHHQPIHSHNQHHNHNHNHHHNHHHHNHHHHQNHHNQSQQQHHTHQTASPAQINQLPIDQQNLLLCRKRSSSSMLKLPAQQTTQIYPNHTNQQINNKPPKKIKTDPSLNEQPNTSQYYSNDTSFDSMQSPQASSTQSGYSKFKRYDDFKCWVCGDQSSGNHYGALTCEACKLFFRRHSTNIQTSNSSALPSTTSSASSSTSPPYQQSNISHCVQRNCQITLLTRSSCPECRYRKCIAVGMGVNRTTFGRHTSNQKTKYHSKCSDLFGEIMKLFEKLKKDLENKLLNFDHLNFNQLSSLLIPIKNINQTNNLNARNLHAKFVNRTDVEKNLLQFYNEVVELMSPQTNKQNTLADGSETLNILTTFCLIFNYNIINTISMNPPPPQSNINSKELSLYSGKSSNFNLAANKYQHKHIVNQFEKIDEAFGNFSDRIKILYFLLIMYTTFSMFSPNSPTTDSSTINSNKEDYFLSSINNEETNDIQRTFLDLLNSEMVFQANAVASTRVSLLLKLDQFI